MSEIYQTDKGLPSDINHYGCYFMSILWWINRLFDKPVWTIDGILAVYNMEEADGDMGNESFVANPQALANHIVPDKLLFRGKFGPEYETMDDEIEINAWHKDGNDFDHFCAGNGKGINLYDPWSANGSNSVINGKLIGKRIFRIC